VHSSCRILYTKMRLRTVWRYSCSICSDSPDLCLPIAFSGMFCLPLQRAPSLTLQPAMPSSLTCFSLSSPLFRPCSTRRLYLLGRRPVVIAPGKGGTCGIDHSKTLLLLINLILLRLVLHALQRIRLICSRYCSIYTLRSIAFFVLS
jgi:hypothetical protein